MIRKRILVKYLNNMKELCKNTKCIKKTYITPKNIYKKCRLE